MNNPYQTLEIDKNASDEQIRAAYLTMQKKYHPDNYEDGPLKQLAIEKSQEITAAFDAIMNERRQRQAQTGQSRVTVTANEAGEYTQQGAGSSSYSDIRRMVQNNQLVEAEEILDAMPQDNRTAEWYFLKGSIFFSRGWLEDASNFFSTAVRMDPTNGEYKAALNRINWQKQGNFGTPQNGQYRQPNPRMGGCSACDMCSGLLCADCCCECMGGDLISCC